eukprot:Protomagalhaensia_wolfi_Nauph_80__3798@NODE_384_length_2633_cov_84_411719_g290_i0_p3_GENE_NODE_384_length_2633_cov_84_411719_g290_i0NODE_384_length_2633_cov_84_411719_g290_i0_p3_ORF_typecomplete_len140_score15_22_NODE_384_length_2633_cov_84_411719_g290_i0105524
MQPPPAQGQRPPVAAPQRVRILVQQSNHYVKRLTLASIYMKQANEPALASETVKESLVHYFAYMTDRLLDYTFTSLTRRSVTSLEEVKLFCQDCLAYESSTCSGVGRLNLSLNRRKAQRFHRLDARKAGVSVFKRTRPH